LDDSVLLKTENNCRPQAIILRDHLMMARVSVLIARLVVWT